MISKFFSQSKPIQYVTMSIVLLLVFVLVKLKAFSSEFEIIVIAEQFGLFLMVLLSLFIFDFFVTRNSLTKKNSYGLYVFVLCFAIFPQTILHSEVLWANFFVLLALRRLISLRSHKHIKKKLFDAAFWIALASLFYFWAIVFFILVYVALLVYRITDPKNYVIPIVGVVTLAIMIVSYLIIKDIEFVSYASDLIDFSLDFSLLNTRPFIIGTTILLSLGIWSLFFFVKNLRSQMKSYRPSFSLILVVLLLGFSILVLAPDKNGSELIFLFAPLAIIIANYIEVISEIWFKESLLWILFLTPIAISLL
ncbi:DUF6427 family protein [Psychroserpens sp.]|uniref:DUF6427 family protein n=1 Tax=Psychroserpens sp. TaxID=2020870 RepID=UPI001B291B5A|nr:DUF6427 family protein [Psychroserpens sp.]MBO6605409.1 hypothetical protein [Psychroserpens sp.]MBO6630185.1 hypothetical protein [Psychroserpens sp.]MBO6653782.1 hypothetical protein [Psychroserpens sp.]MBO6682103.1 hypothetical protein [Psychroserpens sp.]MBO6748783.1 hypothetical protein [Psychroserpens sp.]